MITNMKNIIRSELTNHIKKYINVNDLDVRNENTKVNLFFHKKRKDSIMKITNLEITRISCIIEHIEKVLDFNGLSVKDIDLIMDKDNKIEIDISHGTLLVLEFITIQD